MAVASVYLEICLQLFSARVCGRVPLKDRFSADETVRAVVQSIAEKLQSRAAPRRPAKLYTVAMLLALEIRVMDLLAPLFSRIIAWVMLLQHWAAMRADDVQWLDPGRMTLSASGLAGVLRRTKTTGPGRRAREVPIYVSRRSPFPEMTGCKKAIISFGERKSIGRGCTSFRFHLPTGNPGPRNICLRRC